MMRCMIEQYLRMAAIRPERLLTAQIDGLLGEEAQNQCRFFLSVTTRCEQHHSQMDTRPVSVFS
jgi:hypothetical protein